MVIVGTGNTGSEFVVMDWMEIKFPFALASVLDQL